MFWDIGIYVAWVSLFVAVLGFVLSFLGRITGCVSFSASVMLNEQRSEGPAEAAPKPAAKRSSYRNRRPDRGIANLAFG